MLESGLDRLICVHIGVRDYGYFYLPVAVDLRPQRLSIPLPPSLSDRLYNPPDKIREREFFIDNLLVRVESTFPS